MHIQWRALDNLLTHFNHGYLNYYSQNNNEEEQHVFENPMEDIELPSFNQPSIKLVEHLHENKDLECIGEVE
jgi:hypothetical protein